MDIGILMGSQSDWETMKKATTLLDQLGVTYDVQIVSAHRTPDRMVAYAKQAESQGLKVIIAAAGGAAHLPGMIASMTTLPVLGVPIQSKALNGLDSLLSIAQMPKGVPVGTLAIGGGENAALLATSIIALQKPEIAKTLKEWRATQTASVAERPERSLV